MERDDGEGLEGVCFDSGHIWRRGAVFKRLQYLGDTLSGKKAGLRRFFRRLAAEMLACAAIHCAPTSMHGCCLEARSFLQLPQQEPEVLRRIAAEEEVQVTQQDIRLLVM